MRVSPADQRVARVFLLQWYFLNICMTVLMKNKVHYNEHDNDGTSLHICTSTDQGLNIRRETFTGQKHGVLLGTARLIILMLSGTSERAVYAHSLLNPIIRIVVATDKTSRYGCQEMQVLNKCQGT